ncbi:MAG: hypothetical protein IK147_00080 [Clostridia bacterium]|nr:hypothetical protein [Clostridia bacterium]
MKRFLMIILACLFCFSMVAFAGCNKTPEQTNTLRYKKEKLVFTLDKEVFAATVTEIVRVWTLRYMLSSYATVLENKDDIKDFLEKFFNGQDVFTFTEITKDQFMDNLGTRSTVTFVTDSKQLELYLYQEDKIVRYADNERGLYYQADTGDLTSLYESYIPKIT